MNAIRRRHAIRGMTSAWRWRLSAVFVCTASVALGVSHIDLRQTAVLVAAGWLIGYALARVRRAEYWMWCVAIGFPLLATLLIDGDQIPQLVPRYRIATGSLLLLVAVLGLASRRWVFAVCFSVFLVAVIALASFVKSDYVGAPLIWQDLQVAARSWDMFLELESGRLVAASAVALLFPLLWRFEPRAGLRVSLAATLLAAGSAWAALHDTALPDHHALLAASFDRSSSVSELDPMAYFLGSLWHIRQLNEPADVPDDSPVCCLHANRKAERLEVVPGTLPHVVAVLFESTFDPAVVAPSAAAGRFFPLAYPLNVHTVGGATWVAEYALLHGVAPPVYGAGFPVINLLGPGHAEGRLSFILRSAGYATTTIYPVAGRFYGARAFHRWLGIERFVECRDVAGCEGRPWKDRADRLFLDEALRTLAGAKTPQFVFLPTIQQHSPHDAPKVGVGDTASCAVPDKPCRVMAEYRRRLASSLDDFERFLAQLEELDRDVVVLAFGDHIPGDIHRHFDSARFRGGNKRTFFTVWHNRRGYQTDAIVRRIGRPKHLDVAHLDWVVATAAGLTSTYFRHKEALIRQCSGDYCLSPITAHSLR